MCCILRRVYLLLCLLQQSTGKPMGSLKEGVLRVSELPVAGLLLGFFRPSIVGGGELGEGGLVARVRIDKGTLQNFVHE